MRDEGSPKIPLAVLLILTFLGSALTLLPPLVFASTVPTVSLSPSLGAVGTSVTITGSNLIASHNLTVTYDGSAAGMPTTCTTDASGNISSGCKFIVPSSSPPSSQTIIVSDGTNNPTATFTVTLLGVTCSKSTVVVGSATTCKAKLYGSAPTGTIVWSSSSSGTFSKTSCTLSRHGSYSACSVRFTPTATGSSVALTASFGGDSNNPATAGAYNLVVTVKTTKTTISCSPKYVIVGSSKVVNCKATVTGYSPTGNVTWSQSGAGSVSFVATTCTLYKGSCFVKLTWSKAGTVTIEATYPGDSNNKGSSGTAKLTMCSCRMRR
ncbi:MAG: hypothetical protein ABSB26_06620 [Nitrososphaerales archaeon]